MDAGQHQWPPPATINGRPWGILVTVPGDFYRPPTGTISWPPSTERVVSSAFEAPVTAGRWCTIRPPRPEDYPTLAKWFNDPTMSARWRTSGTAVAVENVSQLVWSGSLAVFLIWSNEMDGQPPIGLVQVFDADHRNRTAFMAVLVDPARQRLGWPIEGIGLAIDYVFRHWDLRILLVEATEFNVPQYGSAFESLFETQGRLRSMHFYDGRYWDVLIAALSRERWTEWKQQRVPWLGRPGATPE